MDNNKPRENYIYKLRAIASLYEKFPNVPLPYDTNKKEYVFISLEEMQKIANMIHVELKNDKDQIYLTIDDAITFIAQVAKPSAIERVDIKL